MQWMNHVQPPVQLEVFLGLEQSWVVDQQLQKLWEPRLGGPERCHQHPCGTILLDLRQDSSQDAKGRESIKLESSPTAGEGIHCPRRRSRFPGHKCGKLAVQSACKEVNLWNKGEGRKLFEHHRVKHPFSIVPKIPEMKIWSRCSQRPG